jgi:hypothetical protein
MRCAAIVALLLAAPAWGSAMSGAGASRSQIAIHERGTNINDPKGGNTFPRGTFAIELRKSAFGPGGTTRIATDPSAVSYVQGRPQISFSGIDTLTSKTGTLELAFEGTHIDLNGRLTSTGLLVGPAVEYGTWHVGPATGIYAGWKGSGVWAAASYGYGERVPYSVEWDGYVTR